MPTVQELYELWADEAGLNEALARSLDPRGTDWLYDAFAALQPGAGELVADLGARDAKHSIELVRRLGVRAIALDPLPLHCADARAAIADAGLTDSVEVVEASIESMPLDDASVDWIWCRDVLVHVDADRGLAECARILRPGGSMLAYVTLATEKLEPLERAELVDAIAIETFDADVLERAAEAAGLEQRSVDRLGSEWRESMLELGTWDAGEDLLHLARLRRGGFDGAGAEAAWGGLVWGIYQLLGKTCPTVYVWSKASSS
jgi:ubiquinone/menaquinone biosynthesis C-methylase UbiE